MSFRPGPDFGRSRDEVDARQRRCDQALLQPGRHNLGFTVEKLIEEVQLCDRDTITIVGYRQAHLLTFAEAKVAGEAMYDRWLRMTGKRLALPLERDDYAWADLARAAWEAVWTERRRGDGQEGENRP